MTTGRGRSEIASGGLDVVRLGMALDTASDAFFDVDLAGRTIRWTRGVTLLFGHDPDRLGRRLEDWQGLIHPEDAPEILESGRQVMPSGASTWSREFRFARADGSYAPIRVRALVLTEHGKPTHVVGAVTDLSDIRERERELRAANDGIAEALATARDAHARAELLMRSATAEVLVEWDLETDACSWSPNVHELLGHPASELSDLAATMRHTHPDDGPRALADLREAISSGADAWTGHVRFQRADGLEVDLGTRGYVMRDDKGRPLRVVGSLTPVAKSADGAPVRISPLLTARQRQVLELVRLGRSNKAIAAELGISEQAAKVQVSKLLRKFGAGNRAALVTAADESDRIS